MKCYRMKNKGCLMPLPTFLCFVWEKKEMRETFLVIAIVIFSCLEIQAFLFKTKAVRQWSPSKAKMKLISIQIKWGKERVWFSFVSNSLLVILFSYYALQICFAYQLCQSISHAQTEMETHKNAFFVESKTMKSIFCPRNANNVAPNIEPGIRVAER